MMLDRSAQSWDDCVGVHHEEAHRDRRPRYGRPAACRRDRAGCRRRRRACYLVVKMRRVCHGNDEIAVVLQFLRRPRWSLSIRIAN